MAIALFGPNFRRWDLLWRWDLLVQHLPTYDAMLEIKDRFDLMNAAFEQKDFRVDKNLKVIKKR